MKPNIIPEESHSKKKGLVKYDETKISVVHMTCFKLEKDCLDSSFHANVTCRFWPQNKMVVLCKKM